MNEWNVQYVYVIQRPGTALVHYFCLFGAVKYKEPIEIARKSYIDTLDRCEYESSLLQFDLLCFVVV